MVQADTSVIRRILAKRTGSRRIIFKTVRIAEAVASQSNATGARAQKKPSHSAGASVRKRLAAASIEVVQTSSKRQCVVVVPDTSRRNF